MKNKGNLCYILLFCVFAALCGCTNSLNNGYHLLCNVSKDVRADSIMLFEYEDDYDELRLCGSQHLNQNRSTMFEGEINKPKIAFVQLNKSSFAGGKYYFILESGQILIRVGNGHLKITGGKLNEEYFEAFAERRGIINKKNSLRKKYRKLVADSAVTDSIDNVFRDANKQLSDSMQRLYRKVLLRGDLVSTVIWTQYGNEVTLTEELKKNIKNHPDVYKLVK